MAFTVQNNDGTVDSANAYIELDYFVDYHTTKQTTITAEDGSTALLIDSGFSDDQYKAFIINATQYIDLRWKYKATQLADNQSTEFPRLCLTDSKGRLYEGIFEKLKKATAEYAALDAQGLLQFVPVVDASGQQITLKREKVGPIEEETQYAASSTIRFKTFPIADQFLSDFVENIFRVGRA